MKYYSELSTLIKKENLLIRRTNLAGDKLGTEEIRKTDGTVVLRKGDFEEGDEVLEEKIALRPHLVFMGAGHVAKALYDLAQFCGLDVTVMDDRAELNTEERFPNAERITGPYEELLQHDTKVENPYFVIFTHGHSYDQDCLEWSLKQKHSSYIGMIGSKGKVQFTYENLKKKGITQEQLDGVHSPIGMDINAATPAEIAVSIMGEIIETYRKDRKQISIEPDMLKHLAETTEPTILCRIVAKTGSGPREQGTEMAVTKDSFFMTIGGGAIEEATLRIAREMLASGKKSHLEKFHLSTDSDLGMACGGRANVLFTLIED